MTPLRIGLAIPLQGPGGLFGPSCEKVAELARSELNAGDGINGRPVEIEVLDAGAPIDQFCDRTTALVLAGRVHAVVGWHISSVRQHMAPVLARHRIPYVYTSLHEGAAGEAALCPGETPAQQVAPGLNWLRKQFGIQRWAVVGADYVWPRRTATLIGDYARAGGLELVHESFVQYGCRDFRPVLRAVRDSAAQGVIMLLVGRDAVLFNRQFALSGLQDRLIRFSPLMEENMLLASGPGATENLYVAAGYFNSLMTASAMAFTGSYADRFGPDAPALNNAAESCYEGILALAATASTVGSTDPARMLAAVHDDQVRYEGPRGTVELAIGSSRQRVHIARAQHCEFDVLSDLDQGALVG